MFLPRTPHTPFPEAFVWSIVNPSLKWNHMISIKLIYEGGLRLDITEDATQLITKYSSTINMQMFDVKKRQFTEDLLRLFCVLGNMEPPSNPATLSFCDP